MKKNKRRYYSRMSKHFSKYIDYPVEENKIAKVYKAKKRRRLKLEEEVNDNETN